MILLELIFLLQALLAVLLLKYRRSHLCSWQLRSRQNWHFKIRACCYVRGKKTRMMTLYQLNSTWNEIFFWSKCDIDSANQAKLNFTVETSALRIGLCNTSDWKTLTTLQMFQFCAALSAFVCSLLLVWKFICWQGQLLSTSAVAKSGPEGLTVISILLCVFWSWRTYICRTG